MERSLRLVAFAVPVGVFAALVLLLYTPVGDFLPPQVKSFVPFKLASAEATTATTMWGLKRRILRYAREHGRLPASLSDLPPMQRYSNRTTDAWFRPIAYEADDEGVVTLSSPVVALSFPSRGADGRWSDELVKWSE
jgi:hypothetical protein